MSAKRVLVTGGSRGIGAATALLAAQQGWDIVITYQTNERAALDVVAQVSALGQKAWAFKIDVSKEEEVVDLFLSIDKEVGYIDVLINNAGIISPISSFLEIDAARIEHVLAVNVIGSFLCAREAVKRMSKAGTGKGGCIVNVSSAAARIGSPNEFIDYAASKGAIDTLTIGLAKEVAAQGIRVNAVRPGLIETDMHTAAGDAKRPQKLKHLIPMQRSGATNEVAEAIVWLMSDSASYVNGTLLDVAGGR